MQRTQGFVLLVMVGKAITDKEYVHGGEFEGLCTCRTGRQTVAFLIVGTLSLEMWNSHEILIE